MVDEAGDAVIDTKEEGQIAQHVRAHKFFAGVGEICLYIDLSKPLRDDQVKDIEDAVEEAEDLLPEGYLDANDDDEDLIIEEDEIDDKEQNDEEGAGESEAKPKAKKDEPAAESSAMDVDKGTEGADAEPAATEEKKEDAEKGEAESVDQSDQILEKLIIQWWKRLEKFTSIAAKARPWLTKAFKIAGPGTEKVSCSGG
jgi:hypothetical protein